MEYLTDPREIRKLLRKVSYGGGRIDDDRKGDYAINAPAGLVKYVKNMAAEQGLSGEDEMTLLAYHALLRYEDAMDRLIDQLNTTPSSAFCRSLSGDFPGQ